MILFLNPTTDESPFVDDADAISFLRRFAQISHLSKRGGDLDNGNNNNSNGNNVNNNNNNADLRRRSGSSGQTLNALWKTRCQSYKNFIFTFYEDFSRNLVFLIKPRRWIFFLSYELNPSYFL